MRKVQILGGGCAKCERLMKNARQAAEESGIACDIVKVTDIVEMLSFNPVGLPALAIDGHVKVARRVPDADEIRAPERTLRFRIGTNFLRPMPPS